ncbi:unnamed protein product, partial [Prorocentrum cordatum]
MLSDVRSRYPQHVLLSPVALDMAPSSLTWGRVSARYSTSRTTFSRLHRRRTMTRTTCWFLRVMPLVPQVRFPLWAEADVPAILLPPAVCGSWRGPVASAGAAVAVCVLYFHANACDIGECVADAAAIRDGVFGGDAVVLAPEYPGYGLLDGFEPSVEGIDMVAKAAWRFCCDDLGFLPTQVVLWGRSIGTGPASALACSCAVTQGERSQSQAGRPVGALVLLAPFTSVSDVVLAHSNSLVASLVDPMWNIARLVGDEGLKEVPLCVVHPKDDEVIPLEQGLAVLDGAAARLKFGLWLAG